MSLKNQRARYDIALWLIVGASMLAYIAGAIIAGGDVNWDFRNYHYYNAWLALHGGHSHDYFPAQIQTWLNPALDIPTVLVIEHMPPEAMAVMIAFFQSLSIPLLVLLLQRTLAPVFSRTGEKAQLVTEISVLIAAITAPMALSELGAVFGDLEIAPLLLGSLLGLAGLFKGPGRRTINKKALMLTVSAGVGAGLAAGLKLTYLIYMPGLVVVLLFAPFGWLAALQLVFIFGIGSLLGLLISGGTWAYGLWHETGNPVFPAYNGIFHSPWLDLSNIVIDQRFYVRNFTDAFLFPFRTAIGDHPGAEPFFTDARFALAALLLLGLCYRRPRGWSAALIAFFVVSYALWLPVFGIERYIVPLELLAPLVITLLIGLVVPPNATAGLTAGACLAMILMTSYPDWINRLPWNEIGRNGNWFHVSVPAQLNQKNEMFLTSGWLPTSFIIPFLPEDARQVRVNGDFEPGPKSTLFERRQAAVMGHEGPMYLLTSDHPDTDEVSVLQGYGWRKTAKPCLTITSNFENLYACSLEKDR